MGRSWSFGQKLGGGFAIAGVTLLIVGYSGYQSTQHLIENEGWVAHSHQLRREIADLLSLLKDAETGQRGFVITALDSYLEPYQAAVAQIYKTFDEVRTLSSDNASQQKRLDEIRPLIDAKLAELKHTIELRRTDGFEATQKFISAGAGKGYMDQVRVILADMDKEEDGLLVKRHDAAKESSQTTTMVILWGSLAGLLLMIGVGWFITSSLSAQIGAAVQHVQSSSSELQSAASQQVSGTKEQSASMNEISTTISELLATSKQIAESAQRVAHIAGENASAARSGEQTVQSTHEAIAGIKRQVDLIVTHMLELGKKSQQIGGILEIINELSEQTNILAINATIEAAGAGDAGKRFAVVADEIRKLADRVGGSTKEIRGLIDEIRAAVNTTVMTTEGGTKAVDAGAIQFGAVTALFKQIAGLVQTTTEAAREIELSTKQQSTAVEQVNMAVVNVAQATRETEASSKQTFQTASELTTLARDLMRIVQPQAT